MIGRPQSEATKARLALPCCEKCRNLVAGTRKPRCALGHRELDARSCVDFKDVSRPRIAVTGGVIGRISRL